ncbi:hypothetical protein SAMN02745163_02306 [Clostridium cavendishii DSM 21758]|uniref:DUF6873 domain-containing protein n=1 Tax=Clostridium cavendishii DSM 21758 TaxID=1121302 RepID=A0A1M6KVD2_9CLOT|nr:hypothetical protein [Clostridium cavendishii]SHJ62814.1 hypothetical protein SAMN02745163_02306 [Clostridium cavendishii DSM 21758]
MKTCFIDYRTPFNDIRTLSNYGLKVIKVPKCNDLYTAINGHPDIQLHIINNSEIIVAKNTNSDFISTLKDMGLQIYESSNYLQNKYPNNIILNALSFTNFFVHNLKYTDKILLNKMQKRTLINVPQGYTKCSCAVVNENSIITSDKKIYESLIQKGFNILLLPPGDIILEGFDYGFIGGTCGLISKTKMAFFGSLDNYTYGNQVKEFLESSGVTPIYLNEGKLVDRGSILTLL